MLTKVKVKWKEDAISHFMTELIDYAGLFPPAELPLKEAISNYHRYIHESDSWMLGPFVIPASRLCELEPFRPLFNDQFPLRLSVILTRSRDIDKDLEAMKKFLENFHRAGTIEAIEVPPLSSQIDSEIITKLDNQAMCFQIFCEVYGSEEELIYLLDKIQTMNQKSSKHFGVKLRMGGVTGDLFPSAKRAALVIHETKQRGLTLKFTAGLHHPIRQYRKEVETFMHGFVNVFTASILAYCLSINKESIQTILLDETPTNFMFKPNFLSWRNLSVSSAELREARDFFALSYGSCSFDEPREELGDLTLFYGEETQ